MSNTFVLKKYVNDFLKNDYKFPNNTKIKFNKYIIHTKKLQTRMFF